MISSNLGPISHVHRFRDMAT